MRHEQHGETVEEVPDCDSEGVRERQRWMPGQELALIAKGNGLLLVAVPPLEDLRRIAEGADREGCRDRNDRY